MVDETDIYTGKALPPEYVSEADAAAKAEIAAQEAKEAADAELAKAEADAKVNAANEVPAKEPYRNDFVNNFTPTNFN